MPYFLTPNFGSVRLIRGFLFLELLRFKSCQKKCFFLAPLGRKNTSISGQLPQQQSENIKSSPVVHAGTLIRTEHSMFSMENATKTHSAVQLQTGLIVQNDRQKINSASQSICTNWNISTKCPLDVFIATLSLCRPFSNRIIITFPWKVALSVSGLLRLIIHLSECSRLFFRSNS